jgi:hypothetical protein
MDELTQGFSFFLAAKTVANILKTSLGPKVRKLKIMRVNICKETNMILTYLLYKQKLV